MIHQEKLDQIHPKAEGGFNPREHTSLLLTHLSTDKNKPTHNLYPLLEQLDHTQVVQVESKPGREKGLIVVFTDLTNIHLAAVMAATKI